MEISANADRCTRSGSVTQYTFKSIQKRMSEDEVHDKLSNSEQRFHYCGPIEQGIRNCK